MLTEEFEYYKNNQESLVSQYDGKVIVIIGKQVIGVYDSDREAVDETVKSHALGTFLVQHCAPGEDNYTVTFYTSRVQFV